MASWITHLMIADEALKALGHLDQRGFCVGSIAPDCNVENEDWTAFTPPREVTHWMNGKRKDTDDCERFRDLYFIARESEIESEEEYAFLLGYYAHLIEDARYTVFLTDKARVKNAWERISADARYSERAKGLEATWRNIKNVMDVEDRNRETGAIEREYLDAHPQSGFLTEILPLEDFPDYIDYLPKGAIRRKIGVMGVVPASSDEVLVGVTREELFGFVKETSLFVIDKIREAEELFRKGQVFAFHDTSFLRSDEIVLKLVRTCPAQTEKKFLPAYRFEICLPDGTRAGECDLRIGYNDKTYLGGNIGYRVDEPFRGHHYAAKAIGLLKELARKHDMAHLFISCAPENSASEKSILRAGGEYVETRSIPKDHEMYLKGKRAVKIYKISL